MLRWRQLLWQLMGTTFVSQTDLLFAPVFGWFLCVPKYLAGSMTLGELTSASAAFVTVQVAFNWLVGNYQRLSDWRSAASRVAVLLLALDQGQTVGTDEAECVIWSANQRGGQTIPSAAMALGRMVPVDAARSARCSLSSIRNYPAAPRRNSHARRRRPRSRRTSPRYKP